MSLKKRLETLVATKDNYKVAISKDECRKVLDLIRAVEGAFTSLEQTKGQVPPIVTNDLAKTLRAAWEGMVE